MNGTLEDTTPAGVLQVLSSQRSTGAVRFLGDSACTVYLHRGELYFAENADTADDLAVALVRPGRLTADQWDSSTDKGYPTETVGEELVATGGITREMLASVVLSIIYDPLIQLFRAPEGDYEFSPDVVHWIGPYRTFDVDAIVSEVRRRTREADEMAPVVPSLDAVVRSARSLPETHGSVNLRRDDWEVVIAAATGCTVNTLAADLGRGRWSTARIVYRLANADLLMVSADDTNTSGGSTTADTDSTFGFGSTTPPPLDDTVFGGESAFEPSGDSWGTPATEETAETATADPWGAPAADDPIETAASDVWGVPASDAAPLDEPSEPGDAWGEFESTTAGEDRWDPSALYGDSDNDGDTPGDTSSTDADAPWGRSLSAVPDPDETTDSDTDTDEASTSEPAFGSFGDGLELHPDIAKALAESTYADSATAINAMAARLGAIESDDDDDWEESSEAGGEGDGLWSGEGGAGESSEFIWKPAAWDTGVESAPLPQRESAHVGAPSAGGDEQDPAWLNSLYSEFMPGEHPGEAPPAPEESAPKQRSIKRLLSAFRRL